MGKSSKTIGDQGEDAACKYIEQKGSQVLERNFHSQQGEIDIVARDGDQLVFVEVKNYSYRSYGSPLGSVRKSKRESIIHAARTYLYKNKIKNRYCRFDVVAIYRDFKGQTRIDHIKNAFYIR